MGVLGQINSTLKGGHNIMAYKGKNSTESSRELVYERTKFDAKIIAEMNGGPPVWQTKKIKDFRGTEKIFVGRIDHDKDSILLKTNKLKTIGANKNVMVLNFVADSFSDLSKRFQIAINSGQVKAKHAVYSSFSAKKGYVGPIKAHKPFLAGIVDSFVVYVEAERRQNEILDFLTFFPVFRDFLLRKAKYNIPITKSFFMKSNISSPLSSGLMVEIYDGDYSDDSVKHNLFYKQKDFEFLKNIAYQHGFVIDKHIPWRLVADISSPNLASYINRRFGFNDSYGLFFSEFYTKAYAGDLDFIIKMSVAMYNKFVSKNPVDDSGGCGFSDLRYRTMISYEEALDSKIFIFDWLDLYTRVRSLESGIDYSEPTIDRIVGNSVDLLDIPSAMRYINSKFNNVEHLGGSLFYDVVRRKKSRDPDILEKDIVDVIKRSVQTSNFKTY